MSKRDQKANRYRHRVHVLHIISGDLWGGAEVQLLTLARAQHVHSSTKVSVVILNRGRLQQELVDSGIDVVLHSETELSSVSILRHLITTIKDISPDIIQTHRLKENVLGGIAARICGDVPSLRTVHGAGEHRLQWYQLHKHAFAAADWVCGRILQRSIVAVSDELAFHLRPRFGGKVTTIRNGIDVQATRSEAGLDAPGVGNPDESINVGFIGRLVPVKRVDIVIEIAQQLKRLGVRQPIRFLIYGDGPLLEELKALSRSKGVSSIVRFQGHSDNMLKEMRGLDAVLLTSDHEGMPIVILEAMAIGTPVVAHAVGGIPDLLNNGTCGVLLEDQDPLKFAGAINRLIDDNSFRQAIISAALSRVARDFSSEKTASEYQALYRAVSGCA